MNGPPPEKSPMANVQQSELLAQRVHPRAVLLRALDFSARAPGHWLTRRSELNRARSCKLPLEWWDA
jgi:hypothetical protein